MSRSSTNYSIKRHQLVKLFMAQGYENTTISDILKVAKISKGALYHYFIDKEEILDSVLEYIIEIDGERLDPIVDSSDLDAIEKLIAMMNKSDIELPKEIEAAMNYSKNRPISLFDYRARDLGNIRTTEAIKKIVLEGMESNEFQTDFLEESAEMLYAITQSMSFWISRNPTMDKINKEINAFCFFLTTCLNVDSEKAKQLGNSFKKEMKNLNSI